MTFRCRMYRVVPGKLEAFNAFFLARLLPVQQRYGAELIGRWVSEGGNVLLALWAYESLDAYKTIQRQVDSDPDAFAARAYRKEHLDPLFTETQEWLMTSTVPLELTALSSLTAKVE